MSYGDDSISKTEYNEYMSHGEYDRVSVDWYKEINKEQCLEQLFYDRTRIDMLPWSDKLPESCRITHKHKKNFKK